MWLQGLDRVYFKPVSSPGGKLKAPPEARAALPADLKQVGASPKAGTDEDSLLSYGVRDFPLTKADGGPGWMLREVRLVSDARLNDVWWALYEGSQRGEVWHFFPEPSLNDGKLLANYRMERVLYPAKGTVVFRIFGDMYRPGGAWWASGVDLAFAWKGRGLALRSVVTRFSFYQGHDSPDSPEPPLWVATEQEAGPRLERRILEQATAEKLAACEFMDPTETEPTSWDDWHRQALCLTDQQGTRVVLRDPGIPSFIERGWKDPEPQPPGP